METVKKVSMHPLPTSQHWSSTRTDDDIVASVQQFLQSEGTKLHGKTWQDTTAEVTQWLGSQIQQEREGWTHKTRAALQEIEAHRKETLKVHGILQESADQMKLVAECCNIPEEAINKISAQDARVALPLYIECFAGVLNSLMEERILCLQILRAEDKDQRVSLPNLLKSYIENLKHHAERSHKEARSRIESLEAANKQCFVEMQKMKKLIGRKQDDIDKLHSKLQEIKDITFKKFKEVKDLKDREKEAEEKATPVFSTDRPNPSTLTQRSGSPVSHYSAPTPISLDETGIKISEEKLTRLRKSAKKLENSLQDALSQMDTYRKTSKPSKFHNSLMFSGGKVMPFGMNVADVPPALRKEMRLLPSPLHTWTTKFEVTGPASQKEKEKEKETETEQEKEKQEKKLRDKQKALMRRGLEKSSNDQPTFRSLMKSLDDVKKNKGQAGKFKSVTGQVTKCLRCNKLFTLNDNHKKACCYHPKGKERIEQYSDRGKLVKVSYVWKCCMSGPDSAGCSYGQHI